MSDNHGSPLLLKRIAVMPVQLNFEAQGAAQTSMQESMSATARHSRQVMTTMLRQNDIAVVPATIADSLLTRYRDLAECLQLSNKSLTLSGDALARTKSENISFVFLGDWQPFAQLTGADYILLLHGSASVESMSLRQRLASKQPEVQLHDAALEIQWDVALVNAKSSTVFWFHRHSMPHASYPLKLKRIEDILEKMCREMVTVLPASLPSPDSD